MNNEQTPLILRGYTEKQIAQNVRNALWPKYNFQELQKKINQLQKDGEPFDDVKRQLEVEKARCNAESDELLRREIADYRASRKDSPELAAFEELMSRIDELQGIAEEAQGNADEAMGRADELESRIDELEARLEALEGAGE